MKKLFSLLVIAGMLLAMVPPVAAADEPTEIVEWNGAHPIKDKIDANPSNTMRIVANETYFQYKKLTFPHTFNYDGYTIVIKNVSYHDNIFTVWLTANKGGVEIATRSPVHLINQPIVVVESVSNVNKQTNTYTTTVREDSVIAAAYALMDYVKGRPFGPAQGDDSWVIYATNDAYVTESTDAAWSTMLAATGDAATNNPATQLYAGYTTATTTTDVMNQHSVALVNFPTSSIDDSATLDSAILTVKMNQRNQAIGTVNLSVIDATPASSAVFAAGDYDGTTFTRTSLNEYSYADTAVNTLKNFTFTAGAIANISKTGNSTYMLDHTARVNASSLTWASGGISGYIIYSVAASSGAYKPYLTVTGTLGGDTTPPLSITSLTNTTATTCNSINFTWVNPTDADFNHTMIYRNNTFIGNFSNTTTYQYWTGLPASTEMTISTHTVDIPGNVNTTWVNASYTLPACADTTPPASVTNLANVTTCSSINFTWTPPGDADFAGVAVYNNTGSGAWYHNVTTPYDLWTSLSELAPYGIGTHTYDSTGNINSTWVNQTAYTGACGSAPVAAFSADDTTVCYGSSTTFTDTSSNTPTEWLYEFGDGNTSTSQNPTKTYNVLGAMNVNLKATNAYGSDWENKTAYITVSDCSAPPTACVFGTTCLQAWERVA